MVNERGHLRASLGWWRVILQETTQGFRLGRQGVLVSEMRRPWASPRSAYNRVPRSTARAGEITGLGKLAFTSLWLLVFSIPWEDAITISDFGTSARLVGMVTVGLGFLAIIERGAVRHPATGHVMLFLFVLLAALSYLWSLYPEGTVVQVFSYVQLFAMVWLIWELSPRAREQLRLMQAYVFGTFVSGVDTIYLFLSHQESVYQRYAGARLDANDLGLMMALSIPLSYYLLIQAQGRMVWVYRLQLVLAGTTILLTASRGAALASIVALTIVPLTHARLTGRQKIAVLFTVLLLVCGTLVFVPSTSWDRLSTMPGELTQGTLTGRTVIWKAGWDLFRAHPVLGVGANAFRTAVSRVLALPLNMDVLALTPVAHNTFLSVLAEEGAIGFILFCALLSVLALSLRALPPFQQQLWLVCLGVWVIGVSGLTWEMRKPTWFFFGLLIAQCGTMVQKRATQNPGLDLAEIQLPR
jgi:O-antigen ligase